jgi:WhiB family redox-sensing transcriptional regulator
MWDAACATADPDLFHPAERRDPAIPEAKCVCARCPVKTDCLEYSLTAKEEFGIWGGLDEWERRELLDERRRPRRHDRGTQGAA